MTNLIDKSYPWRNPIARGLIFEKWIITANTFGGKYRLEGVGEEGVDGCNVSYNHRIEVTVMLQKFVG
jgi:hypothetical protein